MNLRITHLGLLAVVIGASAAQAQELPTFVGGGVTLSMQPSRDIPFAGPSVSRVGVGGTAIGVTGEAGLFLSRSIRIGFEFGLPDRVDTVQEYDAGYR